MPAEFLPRPVIFGEILFDHFPDGSKVLGGAPFNVAWHLQAFGANPLMISSVGNDLQGQEILSAMKQWGMNTSAVQVDQKHPTGSVRVKIINGEPEYDITLDCAYDHVDWSALPELPQDSLLYHGTLALRDAQNRRGLRALKNAQSMDGFLDINLRAPFWSEEILTDSLHALKVLKLNQFELQSLDTVFSLSKTAVETTGLMEAALQRFNLEQLVVTRGKDGAVAMGSGDARPVSVKLNQATEVIDTVGAGDAFSSVLLLGRCLQWPIELTLTRAQNFAAQIVGIRGATSNDANFYRDFKNEWQLD